MKFEFICFVVVTPLKYLLGPVGGMTCLSNTFRMLVYSGTSPHNKITKTLCSYENHCTTASRYCSVPQFNKLLDLRNVWILTRIKRKWTWKCIEMSARLVALYPIVQHTSSLRKIRIRPPYPQRVVKGD